MKIIREITEIKVFFLNLIKLSLRLVPTPGVGYRLEMPSFNYTIKTEFLYPFSSPTLKKAVLRFFDMASHLGLKPISRCVLAKKEKLLVIFQYVLKNINQKLRTRFPYFGEKKSKFGLKPRFF
jgi:hypothetical protein